jgi:hypothetical protein
LTIEREVCGGIAFELAGSCLPASDNKHEIYDSGPSHDGPAMGVVSGSRELMKFFLESLILAQDERWRRA